MKFLIFIALAFLNFDTLPAIAGDGMDVLTPLTPATISALKERRALLRSWAPKCADGSLTMSACPFWDAVEYMGMLCLSGEHEYCDSVKEAQDETGRWWRSPGYRHHPDPEEKGPTFSRDMDHGVWAYIVATEDREAAQKYMGYIQSQDFHLCPKSERGWDACTTRATYWTFATQVFDWLEIPRIGRKMVDCKFLLDALYSPIEASVEPPHYQMILTAETLYTYQKMEEKGAILRNKKIYQKIARILHRRAPEVPLYEYLVYGPNESSGQKILKHCPTHPPDVPIVDGNRVYTEPGNGPWEFGSGHYCIFMINALLSQP